jgi:16S rRNA (cytidine1402-2'-O)-methyltransferase
VVAEAAGGTLYLVPVPLADVDPATVLAPHVLDIVRNLDGFIAEDAKSARAFLKQIGLNRPLADVAIQILNEHTQSTELPALLAPLLAGRHIGLVSEAGYPALADPGANLIASAHGHGMRVVPLTGPSSLWMALAASGLNGQRFGCHGYLPTGGPERMAALRALESRSARDGSAELFIEAPYRNNQMLAAVLDACDESTHLCLAVEISSPSEFVRTRTIAQWRREPPDLNRRPTVFVLQAAASASKTPQSRAATPPPSRHRSGARSARRYSRGA